MKKILNFMKKNIFLTIISLFILISLIIIAIVSFKFFINGNNKYGNRLDGIEEVEITSEEKKEIASTIEENDNVNNAIVRIQGKIIYITIEYTEETSIDQAKEIANNSLENFSEDELNFYDVGYFLTSSGENKFNITGNKKAAKEGISFIKS